jgi:glycosyltransferase involved in cell wall biosynthesis
VVIPVYNTAAYLEDCLTSVLAQTYTNLEIVCVDDGSTDDSLAVLQQIADGDPRVRVIRRKHEGVGATRNTGIRVASGELLTFVDSDDVVSPTLVETLVSALGHTDAVMSGWPREGRIVDSATAIAEGIRLGTLNMHGKLLRTEVLRDHTVLFEEDLSLREDIIFNAGYLLQARRITLLPEQLYKHRPRPGSLTSAYRPHKYEELTSANSRLAGLTGHLHTPEFASLVNYLQIRSLISAGLNLHHPDSQVPSASAARLLRTWQKDAGDLPVRHGDPKMRLVGLLYNALGLNGTVGVIHRLKWLRAKLPG